MSRIEAGGVIAAGEGSRLGALATPKPLVEVGGVPLVEHVLSNFEAAGIAPVAVTFNAAGADCAAFVRKRFPKTVSPILMRTTASSLESFRAILAAAAPGRLLVSTVDAICSRRDFLELVRRAEEISEDIAALAVTTFVDDEKPLWVRTERGEPGGRIVEIGGASGDAVTAGVYVVPEKLRRAAVPEGLARLRDYLGWLVASGEPLEAIPVGRVVDVDRPEDLAAAEQVARPAAGNRA